MAVLVVGEILNVRFGSLAVIQADTSSMTALGRKADIPKCDFRLCLTADPLRILRSRQSDAGLRSQLPGTRPNHLQ